MSNTAEIEIMREEEEKQRSEEDSILFGLLRKIREEENLRAIEQSRIYKQEKEKSVQRHRIEARKTRIGAQKTTNPLRPALTPIVPMSVMRLQAPSMESLVQAAKKIGLTPEPLPSSLKNLDTPSQALRTPDGGRIMVQKTSDGQFKMLGEKTQKERIKEIGKQHAFDMAVKHLQKQGMRVETKRLANGEIEIKAKEERDSTDGKAAVTAKIHSNGNAFVDVENLAGTRCGDIVKGLAGALGGKVTKTNYKSDAFRAPVHTKKKISLRG